MLKIINKSVLIVAFFAVFVLEWYTPIHSDDYRYYLLGLSFDAHLQHYMNWSGRIVADYASAFLLATESRFVISSMTAGAVIVFCYFIVKTPTGTLKWGKNDTLIFTLIFLTFWIANPNIGEVVFWVVGSANYLWTNLFVVAWIWNLYRIQIQQEQRTQITMLLLGILAGCSNESVAPFVVGLSLLALVYDLWKYNRLNLNKSLYFVSVLLGAVVLIFSPGNFIRAHGSHQVWYDKPLIEKLIIHLSNRFFNHLALIWISYVVLALLAIILLFCWKKKFRFSKFNLNMIVVMLLTGIGTSLIMVAAPSYPDRVMMSTFMFILLAISFLARELANTANRNVISGILSINALMSGVFIWSFYLMYDAYTRVYQQDQIRINIVKTQQEQGISYFTVPDFHFLKMQNSGGEFGFFHDPQVYGQYFGVGSVEVKRPGFDYSVLATGKKQVVNNFTTAWYNDKGALMLISTQPLTGELRFELNGTDTYIPVTQFKTVQINDDYWYYKDISSGKINNLSN